nr:DUF423 domain-containing protein [uncultured Gellertiella sp.]
MMAEARALNFLAGLLGAAGVALAAAASHGGDSHYLGNASLMCLVHAPTLLALSLLLARHRAALYAGWMIGPGTVLFAADLVSRHFRDTGLFAMAAPSGGLLMIAGWLVLAIGSLWPARRDRI